ncbi:hypothetical protein COU88_03300 [Candidatus Roizmanbacteria bacterium CG10_big_fil_rev_8_21_14_0_10_39_6]|uniref:Amidohydrolase-related domain-containing protein n=1 Tax=Candidatus Roizmanbacteria bacterium CG10_big_fil_rev_8_21_14_0_10_39_6 TaxID=1974853 RepID=A0A2M8KS47_9BACT|nr:MAG: hypothetical protein COU88_03300 [Candidatus Roizmanbacteria bacterium CG10_big_fil_rev_8_21_14_0_10_39_6]
MIIDTHIHLSSYTGKGTNLNETLQILLNEMKQNGINYGIVIPDSIIGDPHISDLQTTAELIKKTDKLFMLGSPQIIKKGSREVGMYEEQLKQGKIRGLKFFPGHEPYNVADERCMPYYEVLQDTEYPIVIHTGEHSSDPNIHDPMKYNDPKYAIEIAKRFPKLMVVITHYFWPKLDYCYEITKDVPNIFFELAGCADDGVLQASGGIGKMKKVLLKTIHDRPKQVFYGTDWPLCDSATESGFKKHIDLVISLKLDKATEELVFYKNAIRIYKLNIH